MTAIKLYNDYNSYLRSRYGCKVYRIGLDAGFSCPNRDGTIGRGGCIYCGPDGSRAAYADPEISVEEQLSARINHLKKTCGARFLIAYFQAFTNTHAPAIRLKEIYDKILNFKDIVGISIGTRPDSVDDEKLSLIASYMDRYDTWIEYGLQSIHDRTLSYIGRGHCQADFIRAVESAKRYGIKVCAHAILGLPGETREDMQKTAGKLTELKVDGIKIHVLHVLKGSRLEKLYRSGEVKMLGQDEYADLACDFLERLSPDIIIQRMTGQGNRLDHVAPDWAMDKTNTIGKIHEELRRRGSYQGSKMGGP